MMRTLYSDDFVDVDGIDRDFLTPYICTPSLLIAVYCAVDRQTHAHVSNQEKERARKS